MMFHNCGGAYPEKVADLAGKIEKAINGEYSAIVCYEKLIQAAPSNEERERIREIREDEIRHYQLFCRFYTTLTGRTLTPHVTEECPEDYCDGLRSAFMDEQETVDFYLDIFEEANEPAIKEGFHRAAADEQNHAVWFLYFLNICCRKK